MVFISRGRGRGANRGRGRGVGEVSFESRGAQGQPVGRESRQAPESLRITVGNDQFRDRKEDNISGRLSPSVSQRLGPPKENYDHLREAGYRREDDMYRREAEMYGHPDRDRFEREREPGRRDPYSRDPYHRPEEREYGDRRGLGGGGYEQPPADYRSQPSQPLFPSASRTSPPRGYPAPQPAAPSPAQTSTSSRPLKSILKKKSEPVPEHQPPEKPSGLPGIANYMDDIEDEDKFLYGGEDDRRNNSERDRRGSGQYRQHPHGVPVENMTATNIRSAAQSWQPSAPEKTVSGVVSDFVNAQREYVDNSKPQQYGIGDPFHSQPVQTVGQVADSGGNDLWSMLAKSVQTAQQQQPQPNQFEPQLGSYQPPLSTQSAQQSYPAQPAQGAQEPAAAHDPTIENILKSIGFDFEMSKRMQEKAKQSSGEVVPQAPKPGDPKFINQTASFIGSQMSHEDMVSTLGTLQRERESQGSVVARQSEQIPEDFREREREIYNNRDRRESSEASRGRLNSPPRRMNSPPRRLSSPPRGQSPEKLQRGCSPVSAEGSPPPPMFNLPPITIKRRPNLDRSRSPGWDKKRSLSRSPTRDSDRSRNRPRSRSPSWNRSLSSFGRKRSRSPVRKQTLSPVSPISERGRSRSPGGRKSPIIKRTFNLDDLSPAFRRRVSPSARQRSVSPGRRRSPGRRSSSRRRSISPKRRRSISPNRRRSISPMRRRSRSPFRRRSRSPMGKRASRSPGRRRSPRRRSPSPRGRRRSLSPRGRKRGPSSRSRSRERKVRRSTSRDRHLRGSPGRGQRSSSRDRRRRRSRSRSRGHSKSPRKGSRSVSISSDSDIDGPANKQYFSSPLRLSRAEKQNIPRYYDYPPPQGPPPDFNAPPFPGYGPGPGPPPGTFPPGSQPGMVPVGPPGPPMFTMPPPGMGPPMGPPPGFPYPPPGGPPGGVYGMPGPPNLSQPPPITPEPDMAPPGTVEMPLNIPIRSNLTEIVSEDSKESNKKESEHLKEEKRKERSRSRDRRERSRSRDRRDRSRSRERRQRSRSRERSKDKRDDRRSDKIGSSSNRTVLPPKSRPKAEDIEIQASATSNERVVVMGGKSSKLSSSSTKEEKKEDPEKEKVKIIKEKESMVAKIKALESEFNNLKKQEFDLRKRSGKDSKPDPILVENKKLLEEIKKEIVKLNKQKNDFESRHSALFKREQTTKREIKVTAKKTPLKDEKGKPGDKKEKEEFKVEKGKLMKHYFHDGGDHWCKPCNSIHPNIQDYMHHLASYKHKQTLPSDFRPWMDGYKANDGMIINKKGIRVPLPGIEFMLPVTAYYCQLCKVFLGDVSFGADHFKCESHYINYKKYLAENPIYEKKYKEERDKILSANKTSKKLEQEKKDQKTKEEAKKKNTEKDARVRANEKKWDKSVDDLDDVSAGNKKQEAGKSQIKLSLKDKNQKSETAEKGFGKFNWTKDKTSEEPKNGEKTPEASQEKEKGKINFNISLSGKPGKTFIGKAGAQKKNPLLPPWQPVGKKTESVGKPGEAANLDQFLTTNSGEGKIPVISEKKKISAKEILEAFSGKYKEKEVSTVLSEADQAKATFEKTADQSDAKEKQEENLKTKQEMKEDSDKRMMGIEPESEVPLAEKKPPPPVSQNVPLPDQKPSATVNENDVHKVFHSEKTDESEKPVMETVSLSEISLPPSVKDEEIHKPESEKDTEAKSPEKVVKQEDAEATNAKSEVLEQAVIKIEKASILKSDEAPENMVNVISCEIKGEQEVIKAEKIESDTEIKVEQTEPKTEIETDTVEPKTEIDTDTAEPKSEIETDIVEPKSEIDTDTVEPKTEIDTDTVAEVQIRIENDVVSVKEDKEFVPMEIEGDKKQEKVLEFNSEIVDAKTEHVVDDSIKLDSKIELTETENDTGNTEVKSDDSDTEIDEPVSPVPTRGRGRGRGRKRGGGRGRGRGKTKTTPARSTRSTRSTKSEEVSEETVETIESEKVKSDSDNVDNSKTNKDLELSSSVQVAKTAGGKNKKSASPRTRKPSIKSDSGKMDVEEVSDNEDNQSEASGVSMHMDSDFEVVDDLEDMEVLDEAL